MENEYGPRHSTVYNKPVLIKTVSGEAVLMVGTRFNYVPGEKEALLAHTARAVQDVVEERGAAALLTVLDDKTTFALWKELTSGGYYGR